MDEVEDESTSALLDRLAEIEAAAAAVLGDRVQIVELDKKRQENRLAERQLKTVLASGTSSSHKTWMCLGNTFVKLPTSTVHSFLESNQKAVDKEIKTLLDSLKDKVDKLHDLEGNTPLNRGYYLTPVLSSEDASGGVK